MSEDGVMTKEPRHYKLTGSAAQSYVSAICRAFLHPSAATANQALLLSALPRAAHVQLIRRISANQSVYSDVMPNWVGQKL